MEALQVHPLLVRFAKGMPVVDKGVTLATHTTTVQCRNLQKANYAVELVNQWGQQLSGSAQVVVDRLHLKHTNGLNDEWGNYSELSPAKFARWNKPESAVNLELTLQVGFNGTLDLEDYDELMREPILAGVKDNMVKRLIQDNPLPFGKTLDILGAYSIDALIITNSRYLEGVAEKASTTFAGSFSTMLPKVADLWAELPFHLGLKQSENEGCIVHQIVWKQAVSDKERNAILRKVVESFSRLSTYPYPPTNAAFMAW